MTSNLWTFAGLLFLIVAVSALTACQPVNILNALVPRGDLVIEENVAYGAHQRHVMDIYHPSEPDPSLPVIVFVYGGSWESGSKKDFFFVGQFLSGLGYTTVIPDYRLYPEVQFPAFIDDVALSVAGLATALPQACSRIILMGHSAGAHTAGLLAADPRFMARNGAGQVEIAAFIGLAGPYDLPLQHEQVVDKFTTVQGDEANVVKLISSAAPPVLLLHGSRDTVAEPQHSMRLQSQLQAQNVPVELRMYPRMGHVTLVASLAQPLRFLSPARRDISAFLRALPVCS